MNAYLGEPRTRPLVASGDRLDQIGGESEAVGHRQPVAGLPKRNRVRRPITAISPVAPSTRTRAPSAISAVASRQPTTPGIPYSRLTIAGCESSPPESVTIAPSSGSTMLNDSVVVGVTRTSPRRRRPNSAGLRMRRAVPS